MLRNGKGKETGRNEKAGGKREKGDKCQVSFQNVCVHFSLERLINTEGYYVTDTHMPTSKIKHGNICLCVLQKSSWGEKMPLEVKRRSSAKQDSQKTPGVGDGGKGERGRGGVSVLHLTNGVVVHTFTHVSVRACEASTRVDLKERKCWIQRCVHIPFC